MTYRETTHRCVSCQAELVAAQVKHADCEWCPHCEGLWFAVPVFIELLRVMPTAQHIEELMVHNDGSPRRPCPHCGQRMDLAWIDFLQLDQCLEHGVWLDGGELKKALTSAEPTPELKELLKTLERTGAGAKPRRFR